MARPGDNLPEALKPIWTSDAPNERIEIYDGRIDFRQHAKNSFGKCRLSLKWHPSCTIEAYIELDKSVPFKFPTLDDAVLQLQDFPTWPLVNLSVTHISNSRESPNVTGHVGAIEVVTSRESRRLFFHLPNFPEFRDAAIKDSATGHMWCGRHTLEAGGWRITVDRIVGREVWESTREDAGTVLTHVGMIERHDGSLFAAKDADDLLEGLFLFYSFCKSHWTGPILVVGRDDQDHDVYHKFEAIRVTPERSRMDWIDKASTDTLEALFTGFWKRWTDPNWRSTIRTCVYFFVDANLPHRSAEGAIIQYWAIIEALAWQEFVVAGKASVSDFFGKPGKEKLLMILAEYGIDDSLPPEMSQLQQVGKALTRPLDMNNGAEVLAAIRNAYAHPSPENIRLIDASEQFTMWTFALAAKYACLCMLKAFEYDGTFLNHVKGAQWIWDATERVPWSPST